MFPGTKLCSERASVSVSAQALCGHDPDKRRAQHSPSFAKRGETGERRCLNKGLTDGMRETYTLISIPSRWAHSSVWAWPRQVACSQLSGHTRCVRNVLFFHSPLKGESTDSGRESVDQLKQVLQAAEKWRVGRVERGLDPMRWLVQWRRLRVSKSEYFVVIAEEEIWGALANAHII